MEKLNFKAVELRVRFFSSSCSYGSAAGGLPSRVRRLAARGARSAFLPLARGQGTSFHLRRDDTVRRTFPRCGSRSSLRPSPADVGPLFCVEHVSLLGGLAPPGRCFPKLRPLLRDKELVLPSRAPPSDGASLGGAALGRPTACCFRALALGRAPRRGQYPRLL